MPIKILTIDDDPAMTDLLSLLLKTNKIDAITANNGRDGLALVKNASPDLVLLDMMMPEMDGWEVCEKIRKFSTVPIIVLSALNNPGLVAKALDAGADDYLVKPVPSSVLLAHIRNLTRRSNTGNLRPDAPSLRETATFS